MAAWRFSARQRCQVVVRVRRRAACDGGQTALEYLGVLGAVLLLAAAVAVGTAPRQLSGAIADGVCEVVRAAGFGGGCDDPAAAGSSGTPESGGSVDAGSGKAVEAYGSVRSGGILDNLPPTEGEGPPPVRRGEDPFEPAKCLLSEEQTKDTVVVDILFIRISSSEELKVQQWSDGTVTVERMKSSSVGVAGSVSAGIPGLKDWGGSAALSGSYMTGNGTGGQWLFDSHKSGDPNADLEANLSDAEEFADALDQMDTCQAMAGTPVSPISQAGCTSNAMEEMQKDDPTKMPDVDITKSTTEAAGGVSFGQSFSKSKGKGKGGDGEIGSISTDLVSGSMTEDVVVMRSAGGGEGKGEVTFVYTFSVSGKAGPGGQANGTRMQQVAVTYDAAQYDKEKEKGEDHHPTKLEVTTSTERGETKGAQAGGSVNAGPVTIDVGGGKGETSSKIHTETAEMELTDAGDSVMVEDWLRGRGDFPASDALPSPSDAVEPVTGDTGPIQRLMHDKGKISRLDYDADTDWWNASLGIGFGISAGQVSLGFKLFGIDITHEHRQQTITGDPMYATAPTRDGTRPWAEWTNCTQTSPIT